MVPFPPLQEAGGALAGIHSEKLTGLVEVKLTQAWGPWTESPGVTTAQKGPRAPPALSQLRHRPPCPVLASWSFLSGKS